MQASVLCLNYMGSGDQREATRLVKNKKEQNNLQPPKIQPRDLAAQLARKVVYLPSTSPGLHWDPSAHRLPLPGPLTPDMRKKQVESRSFSSAGC